jgi:hypothetical protein
LDDTDTLHITGFLKKKKVKNTKAQGQVQGLMKMRKEEAKDKSNRVLCDSNAGLPQADLCNREAKCG